MSKNQTNQDVQSLEHIVAFKGVPKDTLGRLCVRCGWRRYEPGEPIVDYLDDTDDVYFIVAGDTRVSIYSVDGKAVTFCEMGPGEIFGEYAAIDGVARSASIEAKTSCLVASVSAAAFREVLKAEPSVAEAVMRHLVAKIRTLTTRIYEFSALAVSNRIQAELLRLAMLAPRSGKGARIDSAPTHAEIASRISTHREAVTREFSRLTRMGVIERKSDGLFVKDVDRLADMVHEVTGE
ncbi:MAG: Crp/Fnr family transcriptional regulator [Hyphomicrobium sp.]